MADVSFDFEAEIDAKDVLRKASLKADGFDSKESASATAKGRQSIVCRHWVRNLCMKGDKCDFLHQYDPNRMPECTFWLKFGKCNDPDCVFKHVANSERPECNRYRLGFCRYGPMCRSRHDRLPRESIPEVLPDWFLETLISNMHLVPRAEEVNLPEPRLGTRPGSNGSRDLALVPAAGTEQGTVPGLPPPIHGKCRYFIIRSMNVRNIQISAAKGIWASSLGNSQRLRQALRDVDHVILVFSATESRNFTGYGKMTGEPDDSLYPGIWGELSSRLSASFRVQWIKQCQAPFKDADHIPNPQNEDGWRRCRDGQELPPSVGERLCRFLWQQRDADLLKGSGLELEPRINQEASFLALKDAEPQPRAETGRGGESVPKGNGSETTGRGVQLPAEEADERARPAPVPLGTFRTREAKDGKGRGPAPVAVGKALASGSSSILAAMAEESHNVGGGRWQPPPPPPGGPSQGWMPPAPVGFLPPAVGYYGPPCGHGYPPPGPYGVSAPPGHYGEARTQQGFWGGGSEPPRAHFARPPSEWEGASSALGAPPPRRGRSEERSRSRSRSHGKRRRRRK